MERRELLNLNYYESGDNQYDGGDEYGSDGIIGAFTVAVEQKDTFDSHIQQYMEYEVKGGGAQNHIPTVDVFVEIYDSEIKEMRVEN